MRYSVFVLILHTSIQLFSQASYYYPEAGNLDPKIPTPEQFLGYPIGQQHTRHDKVIEYFRTLDRLSDRMTIKDLGFTFENRLQITAFITSPSNHAQLEDIRQKHLTRNTSDEHRRTPLIIQLGYNVHGNEPSSTEAALLTAYYLVASNDPETSEWMEKMVIMVDPVYNPDGRDRHTHWANMHKGTPAVADPLDREHNEVWPGGRTNHYWFDLNRDWYLAVNPESKNRLKLFHDWRPYVMTDHHEMGTNSTFYFDPGKYSSNNPIVPAKLYDEIYPKFGSYFATAMNKLGSQYFTKESFDKLYPGYGSSYVNFFGGAGFLFEQASSRGHVQNTPAGPITFGFTIRNQFVAGLTTIRASLAERENLIDLRLAFYKSTAAQAKANPVKAYVFGDKSDQNRTHALLNLLLTHKIDVYETAQEVAQDGKKFEKGFSYVVPVEQENYLMVRSAFEKDITYTDSIFYDASTWSLVHAFNMPHAALKTPVNKGNKITEPRIKKINGFEKSSYAYLMELTDYQAHRALFQMQRAGITVKASFRSFSTNIQGKEKKFGHGTLIIPVVGQTLSPENLHQSLSTIASDCRMEIIPVETGYSLSGIDLGSNFSVTVRPPRALMLMGNGVMGNEAGEVWHLMDQRIGMPITKLDINNLNRVNWSDYNVLIMVNGSYNLDKQTTDRVRAWVQTGGTLITIKGATEWAIRQGIAKQKLVPQDSSKGKPRINFEDAANAEGSRSIGGSIFQVDLDLTSPIGFGFTDRKISVYRNGLTALQPSKSPYTTVAQYTAKPLIGGYLHKSQSGRLANSAAVLFSPEGQGRVLLFADNPNFRGIWYGTNKLFLNALFFGPLTSLPGNNWGEGN
ncbi:MAG: zinc carboxypeptidase [Bacteroidetes bacterium]|nr:zinc carboxypeptidase [Bacteroidota bacterium]